MRSTSIARISGAPAVGSSRHLLVIPTYRNVTALYAATGSSRWRFRVTRPTSPLTSAGLVYVGSSNHHVYAVSEATGKQVWTFATRGAIDDSGALMPVPEARKPTLYIGSGDGRIYSLDASTGAKFAAYPVGANATGVAIAGDAILVTTSSGLVEAVRTHGSFVWSYATDGRLLRPPALVDGTFYAAGRGGTLWAFTPYAAPPQ
jgi:eukaryotic-like serine/threonine-protein kinase